MVALREGRSQLIVGFIVETYHGRAPDRAVHSLDLAIGPRVVAVGQPVRDPVGITDHVEAHRPRMDGVAVPGLIGELDAKQFGRVGHGLTHVLQELPDRLCRRSNELSDGKLGRSVNAHKETELAFSRLQLGDVYLDRASVFATGSRTSGEDPWRSA